jgi:Protein of unknwon function (DUF3310)
MGALIGCPNCVTSFKDPLPKVVVATEPSPVSPPHYQQHPSGIECIQITRHMNFNLGNVFKYIWRSDHKEALIQDLKKAQWYLADEIARLEKLNDKT